MRRLVLIGLIATIAWQVYAKYQDRNLPLADRSTVTTTAAEGSTTSVSTGTDAPQAASFRCDGRTHCSQMTSCAEATFFLRNCPDTKMDGDRDGIPCEQQWCGR